MGSGNYKHRHEFRFDGFDPVVANLEPVVRIWLNVGKVSKENPLIVCWKSVEDAQDFLGGLIRTTFQVPGDGLDLFDSAVDIIVLRPFFQISEDSSTAKEYHVQSPMLAFVLEVSHRG